MTLGKSDIFYIGQTIDPTKRLISHKNMASWSKGPRLYPYIRSMIEGTKYCINDLKLTVIDSAEEQDIDALEQDWISGYDNLINGMHNHK